MHGYEKLAAPKKQMDTHGLRCFLKKTRQYRLSYLFCRDPTKDPDLPVLTSVPGFFVPRHLKAAVAGGLPPMSYATYTSVVAEVEARTDHCSMLITVIEFCLSKTLLSLPIKYFRPINSVVKSVFHTGSGKNCCH